MIGKRLALVLVGSVVATTHAASIDDDLARCRAIDDIDERVACYDALSDADARSEPAARVEAAESATVDEVLRPTREAPAVVRRATPPEQPVRAPSQPAPVATPAPESVEDAKPRGRLRGLLDTITFRKRKPAEDEMAEETAEGAEPTDPALPATRDPDEQFGFEDRGTLRATITRVQKLSRGQFVLTLDNGQIWREIEMRPRSRFHVGEEITIDRGLMGNYRLRLTRSGYTNSVRRLR